MAEDLQKKSQRLNIFAGRIQCVIFILAVVPSTHKAVAEGITLITSYFSLGGVKCRVEWLGDLKNFH